MGKSGQTANPWGRLPANSEAWPVAAKRAPGLVDLFTAALTQGDRFALELMRRPEVKALLASMAGAETNTGNSNAKRAGAHAARTSDQWTDTRPRNAIRGGDGVNSVGGGSRGRRTRAMYGAGRQSRRQVKAVLTCRNSLSVRHHLTRRTTITWTRHPRRHFSTQLLNLLATLPATMLSAWRLMTPGWRGEILPQNNVKGGKSSGTTTLTARYWIPWRRLFRP